MRSFTLQPWTTIRGAATTITSITQDVDGWADDLDGAEDATFWVDVRAVTVPNFSVFLNLETSPTLDEMFFTAVVPPIALAASTMPLVVKTLRARTTAPLARYLRWRLNTTTNLAGTWDATFRVRVAASRTAYFVPTQLAGCVLWLRSDLGITLVSSAVSGWADQSGVGNDASQTSAGNRPSYSASGGVNGLPKVIGVPASLTFMTGAFASPSITDHTAFAVVKYPSPGANDAAMAGTNGSFTVNTGFAQFTATTVVIGRINDSVGNSADASTNDVTSLGNVGVYSTAGNTSFVDLFINGISKATNNSTGLSAEGPATKYVLLSLDGTQYFLNGDAYEFVVFNRVLKAPERTLVHRYLGARYGVSVP
jgi:hypothetical protein